LTPLPSAGSATEKIADGRRAEPRQFQTSKLLKSAPARGAETC
jgi:hypothetical protein